MGYLHDDKGDPASDIESVPCKNEALELIKWKYGHPPIMNEGSEIML